MQIDRLLLEEYNEGVERAMNAYWEATSPIAEYERKVRAVERNRRNKALSRTRVRLKRDGAA